MASLCWRVVPLDARAPTSVYTHVLLFFQLHIAIFLPLELVFLLISLFPATFPNVQLFLSDYLHLILFYQMMVFKIFKEAYLNNFLSAKTDAFKVSAVFSNLVSLTQVSSSHLRLSVILRITQKNDDVFVPAACRRSLWG